MRNLDEFGKFEGIDTTNKANEINEVRKICEVGKRSKIGDASEAD